MFSGVIFALKMRIIRKMLYMRQMGADSPKLHALISIGQFSTLSNK